VIFAIDPTVSFLYDTTVLEKSAWKQRAQTMSRARKKLVHRSKRSGKAFRDAVSAHALAMEEPLRHATQFCQALLMVHRPGDDEIDALAFIAGEAFLRLEDVQSELHGIFAALRGRAMPEAVEFPDNR
jgi:hypothetical protein